MLGSANRAAWHSHPHNAALPSVVQEKLDIQKNHPGNMVVLHQNVEKALDQRELTLMPVEDDTSEVAQFEVRSNALVRFDGSALSA